MKNRIEKMLIILGFLGFFTLIPGVVDYGIYFYFRTINGSLIEYGDVCIGVPEGWVIDSSNSDSGYSTYNLRKKNDAKYIFITVALVSSTINEFSKKSRIVSEFGVSEQVYEVAGLSPSSEVRYWADLQKSNIILMGSDVSLLRQLSKLNWLSSCI